MALYEQQPSQRQWQDRLEQERRNISASVEEALSYDGHEYWTNGMDDDEEGKKRDSYRTGEDESSRALIPPRLSLQSKMLPALRSESFVQSATAAHAAYQRATQERLSGQGQATGQTNIFARLAHRLSTLTSSFAALSLPAPAEALHTSTTNGAASLPQGHREYPYGGERRIAAPAPLASSLPSALSTMPVVYEGEKSVKLDKMVIDAIPATPSTRPLSVPQSTEPQRLGRTTKVRLQSPAISPIPQTTPLSTPQYPDVSSHEQYTHEALVQTISPFSSVSLREPVVVRVRVNDVSQVTTRPDLPAISLIKEQEESDFPIHTSTHETFFGTNAFESGQAEVMVMQCQVQPSSVVHVTLTSNPGQTLVQYVSLHPEVGFTVHLTAPASTRTTFNYALLVPGDL